jgi:hypothetical protein
VCFFSSQTLNVGWNLNFVFMLDGDKQGKAEKNRYATDFGIDPTRIVTIDELVDGIKVIEDLLDDTSINFIQAALCLSGKPSKGQIRRFFQERLASDNIDDLGPEFAARATSFLEALRGRLEH